MNSFLHYVELTTEADMERLGANKTSWRSGAGFQLKNSGAEYKTTFVSFVFSALQF